MKKSEIVILILVILSILCNIFLISQYLKFKPVLNDLGKTYMIEDEV